MTVGSLFAGIGGFDLGFERAGFTIRWQVEIDPFCRAVLAQHWPDVRRYDDVRTVGRDLAPVDVVVGGFPCQPHSLAGRRAGADDERDLWPEFARLIRELEPRWVVAENVPGLLSSDAGRFFGTVLGDLAACGYDAEWDCLPASAFGAPHRRDRVWIVAYPQCDRWHGRTQATGWETRTPVARSQRSTSNDRDVADALRWRFRRGPESTYDDIGPVDQARTATLDIAHGTGREHPREGDARARIFREWQRIDPTAASAGWWDAEPDVGRVAHGVPARVDRLRSLGNSIVPHIAEWIAHRILDAESVNP